MSVGIATMGYFNPAPCTTFGPDIGGIGGEGGGYYEEVRKKPVVIVNKIYSSKERPTIDITEVEII